MKTIKKISSTEFTWERWSGRHNNINDVLNQYNSKRLCYTLKDNIIPLGYIESIKLPVRPRKLGFALLFRFDDSDEKYWIHCPEFGMGNILSCFKNDEND